MRGATLDADYDVLQSVLETLVVGGARVSATEHRVLHGTALRVRSGSATDVGRVRDHNEDSLIADGGWCSPSPTGWAATPPVRWRAGSPSRR